MNMLWTIPILLRIATALSRCLGGSGTSTDWVTIVDSIVELGRRVPQVAHYMSLLTPWIEKIKSVLPQLVDSSGTMTGAPMGFTTTDLTAAQALVKIHEDTMEALVREGLIAQDTIKTDDDVLDNT